MYYLVSQEGVILSTVEQYPNQFALYIVTGLDASDKKPGDTIDSFRYSKIQRIIYGLENIFQDQFYKIQFIAEDEFLLFYKDKNIKVRIRNGDQLIDEWYLLEKALTKVIGEDTEIQEINMKYEDRLSIILKE